MATDRKPRARAATPRSRAGSVTARRTPVRKTTKLTVRKATKSTGRKTTKPAVRKTAKVSKARATKPAVKRGKSSKPRVALPKDLAAAINAALDKKAEKLELLDLRNGPAFTDFFLICNGTNIRQVQAIADGIEESLKTLGIRPTLVEGYQRAEWILLDYFDVIGHVFTPATREFYSLERLWGDAERVAISS